jgi:hypothetical protein
MQSLLPKQFNYLHDVHLTSAFFHVCPSHSWNKYYHFYHYSFRYLLVLLYHSLFLLLIDIFNLYLFPLMSYCLKENFNRIILKSSYSNCHLSLRYLMRSFYIHLYAIIFRSFILVLLFLKLDLILYIKRTFLFSY